MFSVGEAGLGGALTAQLGWTPLVAFSFMVFSLLYVPCVASIATIKSESSSKWAWFSVGYTISVAWVVATLVYQIGRLITGG
jgi:ferrous iron transport protein B